MVAGSKFTSLNDLGNLGRSVYHPDVVLIAIVIDFIVIVASITPRFRADSLLRIYTAWVVQKVQRFRLTESNITYLAWGTWGQLPQKLSFACPHKNI